MADADIKAEMKKTVLELQALTGESNSALDLAAAKIEATDPIGSSLKVLYERVSARAEELLNQLDRLQNSLNTSDPR